VSAVCGANLWKHLVSVYSQLPCCENTVFIVVTLIYERNLCCFIMETPCLFLLTCIMSTFRVVPNHGNMVLIMVCTLYLCVTIGSYGP
jgi:hypothetical protein